MPTIALVAAGALAGVSLASEQTERDHVARGMAALHDYAFEKALNEFRTAQESDPKNVMAVWGEAMTHFRPFWGSVDRDAMRGVLKKLGATKQERAKSASDPRAAGYLSALEALLAPDDQRQARLAFVQALERVLRSSPDDIEARAWLAHALQGLWPEGLPDPTAKERMAALAESVLARDPNHPGGLHYLVHALDSPEQAWRALEAARRYAEVASRDSSHALHMPSHTFLQLGLFDEVIESNEEAFAASRRSAASHGHSEAWFDYHAIDFLLYARLQKGHWDEASRILEELESIEERIHQEAPWFPSYLASKTAVYVVETEEWSRIESLALGERDRYSRDVVVARTLSAIASEDYEDASSLVDLCQGRRGPDRAAETATGDYLRWAATCDALEGYLLFRRGDREKGLERLRISVDTVLRVPAWETPDPAKPPAELLGEVYLEAGRASLAAESFRRALERRPNRFRSMVGLLLSEPGEDHEQELRVLWADADERVRDLLRN